MTIARPLLGCTLSAASLSAIAGLFAPLTAAYAIISPAAPTWVQTVHQPQQSGTMNTSTTRPPHAAAYKFGMLGRPNFDIRIGGEYGLALPWVLQAREELYPPARLTSRDLALSRLRSLVPDVTVEFDQFLGTVSSVRHWQHPLTTADHELDAAPSLTKVRDFVDAYSDAFEITSADLDSARLSRNYLTDGSGVLHLTYQQQLDGIDIVGCVAIANVDREGRIINFGSLFLPNLNSILAPTVRTPELSAQDALILAAADVGIQLSLPLAAMQTSSAHEAAESPQVQSADQRTVWRAPPQLAPDEPIITRLVYFPKTATDLRPAFAVVVPTTGAGNTYDTIIDAVTGEVLKRDNRLVWETNQPATYRIFPSDSPAPGSPGLATPSSQQFPFVDRVMVTVAPNDIRAFSPNGWIPDGGTTTVGNNVDAHPDPAGNNVAGPRPNGGPGRVFDFPMVPTQAPTTWTNAAITQMFYWSNRFHDRLYAMGFNEVSGNFQLSNFAQGGAGADPVQADGQDGGGFNNANWNSTGVDGSSARMQMYIWNFSTPARDSTVEGDIVFHELAHGLSIRLHNGITASVTRSMGEGWSDFFGVALNAEPADDFNANYAVGPYVTLQLLNPSFLSNYYFGIRRFPYSTNININPQTFADSDPAQQNYPAGVPRSSVIDNDAAQVHNMGEIWCNTLLNARAMMAPRLGFGANDRTLQVVVDGMKLHPVQNPNFLQARDAILQGNATRYNSVDVIDLWRAFASRGMGSGATAPASTSSVGVVESYTVPFFVTFTYPNGDVTQLQPNQSARLRLTATPSNLTIIDNSGLLNVSVNDGPYTAVAMTQVQPGQYEVDLPAAACLQTVRYYATVNTTSGRLGEAPNAHTAVVYTSIETAIEDNGETDQAWTVTAGPGFTDGAWERATPIPSGEGISNRGDPRSDYDRAGTGKCWLTENNITPTASNTDVDGGSTILTSRPFVTLNGDTLTFAVWLNTVAGTVLGTGDGLVVQYATNAAGTDWQTVRSYTTASNTWRPESLRVGSSAALAPSSTARIRFVATDNPITGNVVEAAMDALSVRRFICVEPQPCVGDFNADGGIDGEDVAAFFIAWQAAEPLADVNVDGGVDGSDIEFFFLRWQAGEC